MIYFFIMEEQTIEKSKLLNLNLKFNNIELYSLYSLSILIPLVIGKPQLLVGSCIIFLIVFTTLKYGIKKSIPILFLPSITATAVGVLFEGATYFLIYVMPFIMLSNFLLSYFASKRKIYTYALGILLKGGFLFIAYSAMNRLIGLPLALLSSINIQFITAFIGTTIAVVLFRATERAQ